MWAQLIKMRLKPGKDMTEVDAQLRAAEQPGSGLVRSIAMRDQKDPSQAYFLVVFESEEKARAREQDQRRQEGLQAVRATMADIFEGPPEFVDLTVVEEWAGWASPGRTGFDMQRADARGRSLDAPLRMPGGAREQRPLCMASCMARGRRTGGYRGPEG